MKLENSSGQCLTRFEAAVCFQGVCLGRYIPVVDLVNAMCASKIKILEETLKDCKDRVTECDETKQALLKQMDDLCEMLDTIDLTPEQRARLNNMVTTTTRAQDKLIRFLNFNE